MHYKPPKPPLILKSAPRFAQVYWCDFSISNVLPEFDDVHPAVVIRSGQKLNRPHLVLPMTTVDHTGDVYAYGLPRNPNPRKPDLRSWVICNQIYTVASERLRPMNDAYGNPRFPLLGDADMHQIGKLVRRALHRVIDASLRQPGMERDIGEP
jgi:mRNA interferase MazF